jgi:hypothetical protein
MHKAFIRVETIKTPPTSGVGIIKTSIEAVKSIPNAFKQIEKIEFIFKNPKKQRIEIHCKDVDDKHDTLVFRSRNKQKLFKILIDKTLIQNSTLIF